MLVCSKKTLRTTVGFLACILALAFTRSGHAQSPVFPAVDANGVDVVLGSFNFQSTDVAIGTPGAGGLSFGLGASGDNQFGYILASGYTCTLVLGTRTETFTSSLQNSCQSGLFSDQMVGSSLSYSSSTTLYTYRMSDGVIATYMAPFTGLVGVDGLPWPLAGYLLSITKPNGETVSYGYTYTPFCYPSDEDCQVTYWTASRTSIISNLGYMLRFESGRVTAINTAVEFCGGSDCTHAWPHVAYDAGVDGVNHTQLVTNAAGETTTYTYDPSGKLIKIQFPDSASHNINISYDTSSRVSQVNFGYGTWQYSYGTTDGDQSTTVTNTADSTTRVYGIENGRIKWIKNELGQKVRYAYDSALRLTRVTQPENNYTEYTYDSNGNITQTVQVSKTPGAPANIVTSAIYGCLTPATCSKPTSTTDASGYRTDYTYDLTHGGLLKVTAPGPTGAAPTGSAPRPETRITYEQYHARYLSGPNTWTTGSPVWLPKTTSTCSQDDAQQCVGTAHETLTTINYPDSSTPNNLLPISTTTASGDGTISATTSMTYTTTGDLLTVDGPLTGSTDTTRYYYDAVRRQTGVVAPGLAGAYRATRITYPTAAQPTMTVERGTTPDQSDGAFGSFTSLDKQDTVYDAYARPVYSRHWSGTSIDALTQVKYDNSSRVVCSAVRMNPSTFASPPDACTAVGQGDFGPDRLTTNLYTAAGQLKEVHSAIGTTEAQTTASYTYTANGLLDTLTDARGFKTTYEYDGFDRLLKRKYPDPSTQGASSTSDYDGITYDAVGHVSSQIVRGTQSFALGYDNLGRLTSRDAPGSTHPDVSYAYDLLGRLISVTQSGQSVTTGYDALSRVLSVASPLGTVSYDYDAGRRKQMTYPGGFYVTYKYNDAGDLTDILENGSTSNAIATYAYDALGRRQSLRRANGVVTTYGFDGQSRLTRLQLTGSSQNTSFDFGYNPAGQIISRTQSDSVYNMVLPVGTNQSYTPDGLNRYTAVTGMTPTYDERGNLAGDGSKTYGYDYDNRLTSASGGVTLDYDPAGRLYRVTSTTTNTRFLYDGADVIAEYDASGNVLRRYVHGPGDDEPLAWYEGSGTTDRRFTIADERGSVIGIANNSGTVTQVNKYDAYGAPDAGNQGRFQFTGQMWLPEVGLYHYKARAYHPGLGRFMQTDPIGYASGTNLYAYAGNDSINAADPWGLYPMCTSWMQIVAYANTYTFDDNGMLQIGTARIYEQQQYCVDIPDYVPPQAQSDSASGAPPQTEQQDQCPTPDSAVLYASPASSPHTNAQTLVVDLYPGRNALTLGVKNLADPFIASLRTPLTAPANLDITFNITTATGNFSQSFQVDPLVPPGQSWFQTFRNRFEGPGQAAFNIVNRSPYQLAVTLRATPMSCIKKSR